VAHPAEDGGLTLYPEHCSFRVIKKHGTLYKSKSELFDTASQNVQDPARMQQETFGSQTP